MKKMLVVLLAAALTALAAIPLPAQAKPLQGIDALLAAAAEQALKVLPAGPSRTLAVSWFTFEGEKAGVSDLLINGLSTAIANRAKGRVAVVSRQVLDRILEEAAFQMSDLVDPKSQVRIGRQLGADVILTGSLTPLADYYKLTSQLVEVESGVVLGGFSLDFRLEKELAKKLVSQDSTVIRMEKKPLSAGGVATTTTIVEDFGGGRTEAQLKHAESFDGPAILSAEGKVDVDEKGGPDGSPCAKFSFTGRLSSDELAGKLEGSWLAFTASIRPNSPPRDAAGLSLSIRPAGFSRAQLTLVQTRPGGEQYFSLPLSLNEGEWQDLKLPFPLFAPGEKGFRLDPAQPVRIALDIPFIENWQDMHFHGGRTATPSVLVDNVGFYKPKSEDPAPLLESFDDEIARVAVERSLYNVRAYRDYSSDPDNGVERKTPGIRAARTRLVRSAGGPAGSFASVTAHLEPEGAFAALGDKAPTITLIVTVRTAKSWKGYSALAFFARSNLLTQGSLEYGDRENELSFSAGDLGLSGVWSRVRIPFDEFSSEETTLAGAGRWTASPVLTFYFDVPSEALRQAARKGQLDFSVDLDNFMLE
jgi:hypothetical protein